MSDFSVQALQYAVDGLSMRQEAQAGNIANAQTPGFQAKEVDFETSLTQAINGGSLAGASPSVATSTAPGDSTGNNVNLGNEMVGLQETTLRYQAMVDALNAQFRILRGSMGGSFS